MPVIKLNDTGILVENWNQFLIKIGYKISNINIFGQDTLEATKDYQKKNGLVVDGIVGNITLEHAKAPDDNKITKIKSERELLLWIKQNLGSYIDKAIQNTQYDEAWLGAMACRETGFIILRNFNRGMSFDDIVKNMKGDFRNGIWNGYSFWQIDIKSFPEFIKNGDWLDVQKSANKAIEVLNEKANYLKKYFTQTFGNINFDRAITAAYNTGQGNVEKSIKLNRDVDATTFNHDYSKEVMRMREIYEGLI